MHEHFPRNLHFLYNRTRHFLIISRETAPAASSRNASFSYNRKKFPRNESKKRKQRRAPDKDPVVLVSCLARKLLQHFTSSAPVNFAPSSLISISCKSMETGGNLKLKIKIVGKVERRSAKVRRCKTHKVLLD